MTHDATCLSYLGLAATQGLGTADPDLARYLWMHSGLAMRQNGEALGLLDAHVWAWAPEEFKQLGDPHTRPIEDKETFEWIRGVEAVVQLQADHFPRSRPVHVMDIGGDVHEVYETILKHGHGCIIRCGNNRSVEGRRRYIEDTVAAQRVRQTRKLEIPRQANQPARTAMVAVRILRLRAQARTAPEAPCTEVLDGDEWKVLWSYVHDQPVPPDVPPPTIAQAVYMIARLGGHLGRVGDGMPGVRMGLAAIDRGFAEFAFPNRLKRRSRPGLSGPPRCCRFSRSCRALFVPGRR